MHYKKRNRLIAIVGSLLCATIGAFLVMSNLKENIIYFHPPSQIPLASQAKKIRIGGIVKAGSVQNMEQSEISFILTDNIEEIKVQYKGALPALFREGQGIIAEGKLNKQKQFVANRLLTKHDENYKPPVVE